MKVRSMCIVALGAATAISAIGETIRPFYTKENKFPLVGHYEVGGLVEFTEMGDNMEQTKLNDANLWLASPYVRYMATQNMAVHLTVPYGGIDPDTGSSDTGLGDISVGMELRAYEHIYGFPYVIPHATVNFDTADDDIGLGEGESSLRVGTTIGSTAYDTSWHFMLDASYELFADSENIFSLGGAVIVDINERFSLLAQGQFASGDHSDITDEHPVRMGGGMIYKPSERLTLGAYGTGVSQSKEDVITSLRVSYDI